MNPAKTLKLLAKTTAVKISVSDIVYAVAPDKVGGGAEIARRITMAGIDIYYSYATSASGSRYGVVFQTANNGRAIRALNR